MEERIILTKENVNMCKTIGVIHIQDIWDRNLSTPEKKSRLKEHKILNILNRILF